MFLEALSGYSMSYLWFPWAIAAYTRHPRTWKSAMDTVACVMKGCEHNKAIAVCRHCQLFADTGQLHPYTLKSKVTNKQSNGSQLTPVHSAWQGQLCQFQFPAYMSVWDRSRAHTLLVASPDIRNILILTEGHYNFPAGRSTWRSHGYSDTNAYFCTPGETRQPQHWYPCGNGGTVGWRCCWAEQAP